MWLFHISLSKTALCTYLGPGTSKNHTLRSWSPCTGRLWPEKEKTTACQTGCSSSQRTSRLHARLLALHWFSPYRAQWLFHTKLNTHMTIHSKNCLVPNLFPPKKHTHTHIYIYVFCCSAKEPGLTHLKQTSCRNPEGDKKMCCKPEPNGCSLSTSAFVCSHALRAHVAVFLPSFRAHVAVMLFPSMVHGATWLQSDHVVQMHFLPPATLSTPVPRPSPTACLSTSSHAHEEASCQCNHGCLPAR